MNINDIIRMIIEKMKIIVIFPIIAVTVVSYTNYTTQKPVYGAQTVLYTIDKGTTNISEIAMVERLMPNYLLLSQTSEMRAIVREAVGESFGQCTPSITMNVDAHTMTVFVSSQNPAIAANVANTYATCIIQYLKDTMGREDISILETAVKPGSPVGPQRQSSITSAGIIGLILGLGFALLLEISNNTIKTPDELEKEYGLATLAEIGRYTKGKKK